MIQSVRLQLGSDGCVYGSALVNEDTVCFGSGDHIFYFVPATSSVWSTPSFDAESGTVFFGTDANTAPRRPTLADPGCTRDVRGHRPGCRRRQGSCQYADQSRRRLDHCHAVLRPEGGAAATGEVLKEIGLGPVWSGPSVSRGRVYVGTGNTQFLPPLKDTGVLLSFELPAWRG